MGLSDAITLVETQQDYTSRIIVLSMILLGSIFFYIYSRKFEDGEDWQQLRNFFLRTFSFIILVLSLLIVPLSLANGYSFETLINNIVDFYSIGFLLTAIIVFVWMKDLIFGLLKDLMGRYNPRRNYLFGRRRR